MEFNLNGTIKAMSVRYNQRIVLNSREGELIRDVLVKAKNQGKVKVGQVAVFENREWLRVLPHKFNGSPWIEIQ